MPSETEKNINPSSILSYPTPPPTSVFSPWIICKMLSSCSAFYKWHCQKERIPQRMRQLAGNSTAAAGSPGLQLKDSCLQNSSLKLKCTGLKSKGLHEVSMWTLWWHWSTQGRGREMEKQGSGGAFGNPEHSGLGRGHEASNNCAERALLFIVAISFPKMIY